MHKIIPNLKRDIKIILPYFFILIFLFMYVLFICMFSRPIEIIYFPRGNSYITHLNQPFKPRHSLHMFMRSKLPKGKKVGTNV